MPNLLGYLIAISAHILNGSVSIIDKFLLTKTFKRPAAYAFWIGLLSLGTFILLPFGFGIPSGNQWLITLAAGATFTLALYFFYVALQSEEISRIMPIVGSLIPIFTLSLAFIFLNERLSNIQILGIFIIIFGIIFLTYKKSSTPTKYKIILSAFFAALLFALSSILMKEVFVQQSFFSGLAWSRLGGALIALIFLLWPRNREAIFEKEERPEGKRLILFFLARVFSATGFLLVNVAIALISPTVVNALQGFQYVFLFGLTLILSQFWPHVAREEIDFSSILLKSIGIIGVISGSILLAF